jgi:hypothetical protein
MTTINEAEFKKLCDDIFRDRAQIHAFVPSLSRRDALLWMLLGSLVSLLDVPILEQPSVYDGTSADPYADAVLEVVHKHMRPPFDPRKHLAELSGKLAEEA